MKKFKYAFLLMILIAVIGLASALTILRLPLEKYNDMAAINQMEKIVENHWHNPDALAAFQFAYDFTLIDSYDKCLYKTSETLPDSLHYGIMKGLSVIDVYVSNEYVGKMMIDTTWETYLETARNRLFFIITAAFLLIFLILVLFLVIINQVFLAPFQKLKDFARNIAYGNLDTPLPMDRHNIFGPFTESFDIMRQSLREARQREQAADKSKKELIASLSHDIKTPITSIKLMTEVLQAQYSDHLLLDKLTAIEGKASQIEQLTSNLLNATLADMEELHITLADENSSILKTLFENENGMDTLNVSPDLPSCMLSIDRIRMAQIITNIVHNSYKYANTRIDVDFQLIDAYLRIGIKDYGPGVKEEELEYLFNKFYRGSNGTDGKKTGEGLGLYISRILMEKMGGFVECENQATGFLVYLYLPLSS